MSLRSNSTSKGKLSVPTLTATASSPCLATDSGTAVSRIISVTELLQLTQLGIPLAHITWPRVTMVSDQWICIRHGNCRGRLPSITVLNPHHSLPQTFASVVSSAKMNPSKPVIALKGYPYLQVYNLETGWCLQRHKIEAPIHFWTWINSSVIGIVTDTAVHHWDIREVNSEPTWMFDRHACLSGCQIVNYICDQSMKWLAVTGLKADEDRVVGVTQIYSVEHKLSQPIDAHCVAMVPYCFTGNSHPSPVLVAANRGRGNTGKIHVVELGPMIPGNFALASHTESMNFRDTLDQYDFPTSIQVSSLLGLMYITTKYGMLHLCDLETGAPLCTHTICPDIVFATALNQDTQGILAISRNGQVLAIDLKKEMLVKYLQEVCKRPQTADRLKKILNN